MVSFVAISPRIVPTRQARFTTRWDQHAVAQEEEEEEEEEEEFIQDGTRARRDS